MEPRSLKYIATACDGELLAGSPEQSVARVCTDSRQVQSGDLFIALRGDRFDGHDFIGEVARCGVACVMANRDRIQEPLPACAVIAVDDTRRGLGRFAARYRGDFAIPRIAVGGSNGKTTTKELIASVLRERWSTLKSEGSFNNDVGVPLTLLNLEQSHRAAVLEIGTNHPGELAPLIRMIDPGDGVITSIGREHLEFFGDLTGVIEEEGWLAELLPAHGRLYLNGDTPGAAELARRTQARLIRVGLSEENDWQAALLGMDETGMDFQVRAPDPAFGGTYRLRLVGRHQMVNALFAIAAGKEFGLCPEEIRSGLNKCTGSKMRMQLWATGGVRVLDDCYNANADSMRAALETLVELPCAGRRVAVLGDMAELGRHAPEAHAEVGRYAAQLGIDQLFAVGAMGQLMAEAARASGLGAVNGWDEVDEAAEAVDAFVEPGDLVLLKASRSMRLERIAERLRQRQPQSGE